MRNLRLSIGILPLLLNIAPSLAHDRPLGDGKISAVPQINFLMSCQQKFRAGGGGATKAGDWLKDTTYDPALKPIVDGKIIWPSFFSMKIKKETRLVTSNQLPAHPTGLFPISGEDDAYRFDRNPNSIEQAMIDIRPPLEPQMASQPSCVPMGMIGIMLSGSALYNGIDAGGRDAPAHEIQDSCNGHPERSGQYHYHDYSPCFSDTRSGLKAHSDLVGYALDGFGIFGLKGENGAALTNKDLDECHGHTHKIIWDGKARSLYHYHFTDEFPYSIGCFRGIVRQ
jgi:YHYH protein